MKIRLLLLTLLQAIVCRVALAQGQPPPSPPTMGGPSSNICSGQPVDFFIQGSFSCQEAWTTGQNWSIYPTPVSITYFDKDFKDPNGPGPFKFVHVQVVFGNDVVGNTVSVSTYTACGMEARFSQSISIEASQQSSVSLSANNPIICQGENVTPLQLTASASNAGQNPNYLWNLPGGSVLTNAATYTAFNTSGLAPGTYSASVTVRPQGYCVIQSTSNTTQFTVTALPNTTIVPGGTITLCNDNQLGQQLSVTSEPNNTYQWYRNGTLIPNATGTTYSAKSPGSYYAQIASTCPRPSGSTVIRMNALPLVNAGADQTIILPKNITVLSSLSLPGTATDQEGNVSSLTWTQDVGPLTTLNPSVSGIGTGTASAALNLSNLEIGHYTFTLTAGDACPEYSSDFVDLVVAPYDNYNYIRTQALQTPYTNLSQVEWLDIGDRQQQTRYYDGLGRPMQDVAMQASPGKKDIIVPIAYDDMGREIRKYLPYMPDQNTGVYKENTIGDLTTYTLSDHYAFYNSAAPATIPNDVPMAVSVVESSPLNRIIKQGAPGQTWQPTLDVTDLSDKSVKKAYGTNSNSGTNAASDVKLFYYDIVGDQLMDEGYYEANELMANTTTDENGNETIEFTDKLGKTICRKVKADATTYACTYYLYDDKNELILVLPPEAIVEILKQQQH
jgi:hypothetical protein